MVATVMMEAVLELLPPLVGFGGPLLWLVSR